jgi:Sugar (and other) transporter
MNTLFAAGTVALPFTIEKFGRRAIMMWSAVGLTICMTIFVAMIGSPNPTLAMQWTAVVFVVIYNFIFGYGWIGVCWLYGPEVSRPMLTCIATKTNIILPDRTSEVSAHRWCVRCIWRMALLLHHCVRGWHCAPECGLEDLAVDVAVMCSCRAICLLHVSRNDRQIARGD